MENATGFIKNNVHYFIAGALLLEVVLLVLGTWLVLRIRKVNAKSKVFFEGKNGSDLEQLILKNNEDLKGLDKDIQELYNASNKINQLALRGIHRVGVIRFNPFKDIGGDQSFSVALLDGKSRGITISSLHTREGTRVYVKPIVNGLSEKYPLTDEEREAIRIASVEKVVKK